MPQTNFPDWSGVDTAALVISGLLVVFAALCVIILFIWIMGKIMNAVNKKSEKAEPAVKSEKKPAAPAPVPAAAKVSAPAAALAEDGISDEVVVAISAAISAMMLSQGNHKPFAIRSIKRVRDGRSAWNAAGVADNTRPF